MLKAVQCGNAERFKRLISKGADPNFQDDYGTSPLHIIVEKYPAGGIENLCIKSIIMNTRLNSIKTIYVYIYKSGNI